MGGVEGVVGRENEREEVIFWVMLVLRVVPARSGRWRTASTPPPPLFLFLDSVRLFSHALRCSRYSFTNSFFFSCSLFFRFASSRVTILLVKPVREGKKKLEDEKQIQEGEAEGEGFREQEEQEGGGGGGAKERSI